MSIDPATLPPLVFRPLVKVRVWGGEALKARVPEPPAEPVGESWEIADHGEDSTVVAAGPLAGWSLHRVLEEHAEALVGRAADPANPEVFPLMLKLIDANQDLSMQVHPDDAYAARRRPGSLGKSEAWYVLDSAPGGRIYCGLRPGVTRARLAAALRDGSVADLVMRIEPRPGDVVNIPAGTMHALGRGVRVAEIQQNSDTTFRVFDWNRLGLDGKPRELHIEDAMAVTRFDDARDALCAAVEIEQPGCVRERFIAGEKFHCERLRRFRGRPVRLDTGGATFHILTLVNGALEVRTAAGEARLGAWDSVLVPACAGEYALSPSPAAEVLLFHRPPAGSP